jgi:hypothetical protein
MGWHFEMLEKRKDNKTAVIENREPGYNVYLTANEGHNIGFYTVSAMPIHVFTLEEAIEIADDFLERQSLRDVQTDTMLKLSEKRNDWNFVPADLNAVSSLDVESKFDPVEED